MNEYSKTLLTIITESSLENSLIKQLEELGARGYTICDARGKGTRGTRGANWDYEGNIRIEVLTNEDVAAEIKRVFQQKYYENFAMIIYSHTVDVLRSQKW